MIIITDGCAEESNIVIYMKGNMITLVHYWKMHGLINQHKKKTPCLK